MGVSHPVYYTGNDSALHSRSFEYIYMYISDFSINIVTGLTRREEVV